MGDWENQAIIIFLFIMFIGMKSFKILKIVKDDSFYEQASLESCEWEVGKEYVFKTEQKPDRMNKEEKRDTETKQVRDMDTGKQALNTFIKKLAVWG